jgi:thiol-disulfide isomerase/thioredoxin
MKTILTIFFFILNIFYLSGQTVINKETNDIVIKHLGERERLNDLLAQYEGKIVYLDIWATFCYPCIKLFTQKKEMEEYFYQNKIVSIFICFDSPNNIKKWKQIIEEHNVSGIHYFVPNVALSHFKSGFQLSEDYYSKFGRSFPQFLIIGKDGKILVENAIMPNDKAKLIDQLSPYIK